MTYYCEKYILLIFLLGRCGKFVSLQFLPAKMDRINWRLHPKNPLCVQIYWLVADYTGKSDRIKEKWVKIITGLFLLFFINLIQDVLNPVF